MAQPTTLMLSVRQSMPNSIKKSRRLRVAMMAALNKAYISQIPRNMPDPGGGVPGEVGIQPGDTRREHQESNQTDRIWQMESGRCQQGRAPNDEKPEDPCLEGGCLVCGRLPSMPRGVTRLSGWLGWCCQPVAPPRPCDDDNVSQGDDQTESD